jgi:hypothetical protein
VWNDRNARFAVIRKGIQETATNINMLVVRQ